MKKRRLQNDDDKVLLLERRDLLLNESLVARVEESSESPCLRLLAPSDGLRVGFRQVLRRNPVDGYQIGLNAVKELKARVIRK
jgi:hypothetical protein